MKLKINNIKYDVKLVDKLDEALGMFDGDNQVISILNKPKAKIYSTIKHELTHAYLYSYGFAQVELSEEVICDFFETYGERIIKDSKKVYEYLNNKLKGGNNL